MSEAIYLECLKTIHKMVHDYAQLHGFIVETQCNQRIMRPALWLMEEPPSGTEVFISKIPNYIFEDFLIPYFAKMGIIYTFRLMLSVSGLSNRGFAYVTYATVDEANRAILALNNSEIVPQHQIVVQKSNDNKRLFLGGIPEDKSRDEVWRALTRAGFARIVDVIMYRSYSDRNKNRGFVFVEFRDHQDAAHARTEFRNLLLWGQRIQVDWSKPLHDVDPNVMTKVKKLFFRNLPIDLEKEDFIKVIREVSTLSTVEKIYKFRDYAFVHYHTRRDAQKAMYLLKEYFKNTASVVEITWAKPPPQTSQETANTVDGKPESSHCKECFFLLHNEENAGTPTTLPQPAIESSSSRLSPQQQTFTSSLFQKPPFQLGSSLKLQLSPELPSSLLPQEPALLLPQVPSSLSQVASSLPSQVPSPMQQFSSSLAELSSSLPPNAFSFFLPPLPAVPSEPDTLQRMYTHFPEENPVTLAKLLSELRD